MLRARAGRRSRGRRARPGPRRLRRRRPDRPGHPGAGAAPPGARRRSPTCRTARRRATASRWPRGRARPGEGRTLIVTADTGSTSVAEIAARRAQPASTSSSPTTTTLPEQLPAAVALVNPQRPGQPLSGPAPVGCRGGVQGRPAAARRTSRAARRRRSTWRTWRPSGRSRTWCPSPARTAPSCASACGACEPAPRPGLAALLASAGVDSGAPSRRRRSRFALAPRINAMGRMGDATDRRGPAAGRRAATDAAQLAAELEAANRQRRELTATALAEAREALGRPPTTGDPSLVVAGRLAGGHHRAGGRPPGGGARPAPAVFSTAWSPGAARRAAPAASTWRRRSPPAPTSSSATAAIRRLPAATSARRASRRSGRASSSSRAPAGRRPAPEPAPRPRRARDSRRLRTLARVGAAGATRLESTAARRHRRPRRQRVRAANGGHTQLTLRKGRDVLDGISFGRADLAEPLTEGDDRRRRHASPAAPSAASRRSSSRSVTWPRPGTLAVPAGDRPRAPRAADGRFGERATRPPARDTGAAAGHRDRGSLAPALAPRAGLLLAGWPSASALLLGGGPVLPGPASWRRRRTAQAGGGQRTPTRASSSPPTPSARPRPPRGHHPLHPGRQHLGRTEGNVVTPADRRVAPTPCPPGAGRQGHLLRRDTVSARRTCRLRWRRSTATPSTTRSSCRCHAGWRRPARWSRRGLYKLKGGGNLVLLHVAPPAGRQPGRQDDRPGQRRARPRRATDVRLESPADAAAATSRTWVCGRADGLGHNDPEWSPDGKRDRVHLQRPGRGRSARRRSRILQRRRRKKLKLLTARGYANPSWSPDGALHGRGQDTTGTGRDIVIVRPSDGVVVALPDRATATASRRPGRPDGIRIAYLHLTAGGRRSSTCIQLGRWPAAGGAPTVVDDIALTTDSRLDPASRPAWYVPAELLPVPPAAPAPSASGAAESVPPAP